MATEARCGGNARECASSPGFTFFVRA